MDSSILLAGTLALAALVTGLIASIEIALAGLPEARVRAAIDAHRRGARSLTYWTRHPAQTLATLQLVRIATLLASGLVLSDRLLELRHPVGVALGVAVVATGFLWLSYLVPRRFAKRHPLEWALATFGVVRALIVLLWPIVAPLLWTSRRLASLFGHTGTPFWTADELHRVSAESRADSMEPPSEALLSSIIEFSDTVIREIMVPRTEMVTLDVAAPPAELRQTIIDAGHSRIPVYEETVDNVIGLLHVKDMFSTMLGEGAGGREPDMKKLLRPTFFVPEVMKISELLREFQRRKTHMAIVVDEYGGTAGVVTLEDIIEEIVGEIQDEYDIEEKQFRALGENKVIADGRVSVWELEPVLGVSFPTDGGFETLAGFLMAQIGYLPQPGAVLEWNNLRFTIKEANEKRIAMVEIEKPKKEAMTAAGLG